MTTPSQVKKADAASNINAHVKGRFRLSVGKAGDKHPRVVIEFDNLVLDQGLDFLFTSTSGGGVFFRFAVGASSVPEAPSQTGPLALIAVKTGGTVTLPELSQGSPFRISRSATKRFEAGEATGVIAEVCTGWHSGWFSRALVRDVNGEPTTVEVLDDEYLDVTYTLDTWVDVQDRAFTLNLSTGAVDGVLRPALLSSSTVSSNFLHEGLRLNVANTSSSGINRSEVTSDGSLGPVTGKPAGAATSAAWISATPDEYTPGSFERSTVIEMGLPGGNTPSGGFRTWVFFMSYWIAYQLSFDPVVPKNAERIFRLRIRISLGRA